MPFPQFIALSKAADPVRVDEGMERTNSAVAAVLRRRREREMAHG